MVSFDMSGASWEMVALMVTVVVVLSVLQRPKRSSGWIKRASAYLDLADRFGRPGASRAEAAAADALRKKAAERVVSRLRSNDAVGNGIMMVAERFTMTICFSVSIGVNSIIWVSSGAMAANNALASFLLVSLAGLVLDGVQALINRARMRRMAAKAFERKLMNADLEERVELMYRELMELPVVDDLRDRDADAPSE